MLKQTDLLIAAAETGLVVNIKRTIHGSLGYEKGGRKDSQYR